MNVAYSLSLFSECKKRKVGAVITKRDKDEELDRISEYIISGGFNQILFKDRFCYTHDFCFRDYAKLKHIIRKKLKCPFCNSALEIAVKCRIDGMEEKLVVDFEYKESDDDIIENIKKFKEKLECEEDHDKHYTGEKREIIIRCSANCKGYTLITPSKYKRELFYGKDLYDCQAVHAEENAILNSSRFGSAPYSDTTLYTTTFPCLLCTKKIIASGICRIVYMEPYPDSRAEEHLINAGITLTQFEGFTSKQFYNIFKQFFL